MYFLVTAAVYTLTICTLIGQVLLKQPMLGYNIVEMPTPNKYQSPGTMRFPETFFHNTLHRHPASFKGIQYAPLHASMNQHKMQKNYNDSTTIKSSTINVTITPEKPRNYEKENLESRGKPTEEDKNKQVQNCYKVQLNSEVSTTVSRSPGHNAVYRTFQQILPRDKSFKVNKQSKKRKEPMTPPKKALRKINYIRPYGIYRALELGENTKKWPSDIASEIKKEIGLTNKKFVFTEDEINENFKSIFSVSKHQLTEPANKYFTKKLHLNIARVYNTGKQQKVPPYTDKQSLIFDIPSNSWQFQPKAIRLPLFKAL